MAGSAEHGVLLDLTQRIRNSFESLVTVGRDSSGLSDFGAIAANLHNENQRFDLWCRNLGAYQSGHASLEYRLRDVPKIYDYASRLLTDLDCSLTLALKEVCGEQDAHPLDFDVNSEGEPSLVGVSEDESDDDEFLASYNAKPLADILIESISAAIDRLYRLSFKIRNPATRFDWSRVLKFEDIDSETGTDILTYYAQFDQNHIKELLRDLRATKQNSEIPAETTTHSEARVSNEDSCSILISQTRCDELDSEFLVQRLAHANNIRRRQFRYWQTHQKKLAAVKAEPSHIDVVRPAWMHTPSLATTEATKLKEEDIELSDNRSVVSSATYALMQKEPGRGEVRVPPFPKWLEDKKEFECPYCRIACPGSMAKKSAWETHVLRDLRPYICMFEGCRQADQLFDTFQSWRLHEIQEHTVELAESSYGEIHESVGPQGQGRAPEGKVGQQLPTGTVGDTRTCPLCLLPGVSAAHVGAHLQRIAIFALPLIQHSGKTDSVDDEDSNEALGSAHTSSTTTTLHSGRDSDQPLAQGSSIIQDGGETSRLRLDDLIAQGEAAKLDVMSQYLDAEESIDEPSSTFELRSMLLPPLENFTSSPAPHSGGAESAVEDIALPPTKLERERKPYLGGSELAVEDMAPPAKLKRERQPYFEEPGQGKTHDASAATTLNLTAEEERTFGRLFRLADTENIGVVTGEAAVKFFEKSGLQPRILGEIWQIADTDNRGLLTPNSFGVALRLIGQVQNGQTPTAELALRPGPLPKFEGLTRTQPQGGGVPVRVPPLTPDKVAEYSTLFERSGAQGDILLREQAKGIFESAQLPNEILSRIWNLADTEQRGALGVTEFIVAMHLLVSYKNGALRAIPTVLPPGLFEAASQRPPRPLPPQSVAPSNARQADIPPVSSIPEHFSSSSASPQGPSPMGRHGYIPLQTAVHTSTDSDWVIDHKEKAQFDGIFNTIDKSGKGFITGEEAVIFFSNSELSEDILAQIWDLADINSEGQLNRDEFAVAMHLIRQQRMNRGRPLFTTLPQNLVPPSMR